MGFGSVVKIDRCSANSVALSRKHDPTPVLLRVVDNSAGVHQEFRGSLRFTHTGRWQMSRGELRILTCVPISDS